MSAFLPFPELKTPRLHLRQPNLNARNQILYLRSDPTVNAYIHRPPERQIRTKKAAANWILEMEHLLLNNSAVNWCIDLNSGAKAVGTICLWNFSLDRKQAELGYDLGPDHWGNGYMGEAMGAVLHYGYATLKLRRIEAYTHRENGASRRLLERNGFELDPGREEGHNVIYQRSF